MRGAQRHQHRGDRARILDWLVLIEMQRIEKKKRKEDKELLNFFERDRPQILVLCQT